MVIKGGATATSIKVKQGELWNRVVYVKGFPDWKSALQFEWRWKQLGRKMSVKTKPMVRRMNALVKLLLLERPTNQSLSYGEWPNRPTVVVEDESVFHKFADKFQTHGLRITFADRKEQSPSGLGDIAVGFEDSDNEDKTDAIRRASPVKNTT
jgi:hypothetical protein